MNIMNDFIEKNLQIDTNHTKKFIYPIRILPDFINKPFPKFHSWPFNK